MKEKFFMIIVVVIRPKASFSEVKRNPNKTLKNGLL
jgi:hypothetical protein